jgi:hypothetical protein
MSGRQCDSSVPMAEQARARTPHQRASPTFDERCKGGLDVAVAADIEDVLQSERQAANIDVRIEPEPETTGASARQAPEVKPDTKKAKAQTAQSKNRARTVRRPRPTEPMAYAQQPFFGGYRPMY